MFISLYLSPSLHHYLSPFFFREKNDELEKTIEAQQQHNEEAEKALGDFKRQMELTSKKLFDDTKIQVLLLTSGAFGNYRAGYILV